MTRESRIFNMHDQERCGRKGGEHVGDDCPEDCHSYVEYKMDKLVAEYIRDLRMGLNGQKSHTWRAVSIAVTGIECQYTGKELCRIAEWTLGMEEGGMDADFKTLREKEEQ